MTTGPEWCYKSIHCNLSYVCHRLYHFLVLVWDSAAFYHLYSPQLTLSSSFFTSSLPPLHPLHLFLNDLSLFLFFFIPLSIFLWEILLSSELPLGFWWMCALFFDRYKCHCCCGCCVHTHSFSPARIILKCAIFLQRFLVIAHKRIWTTSNQSKVLFFFRNDGK